jgi:hypothetical protein
MTYFFVDFPGSLMDADHALLNEAGVYYVHGRSDNRDNVMRSGTARHLVRVEADDADTAKKVVRTALGVTASDDSKWDAWEAPDEEEIRDPWA